MFEDRQKTVMHLLCAINLLTKKQLKVELQNHLKTENCINELLVLELEYKSYNLKLQQVKGLRS